MPTLVKAESDIKNEPQTRSENNTVVETKSENNTIIPNLQKE